MRLACLSPPPTARAPCAAALADCAQVHRGLGRHISQVKAFNTGTYLWCTPELAVMRDVGNACSNAHFGADGAPPKPSQDAAASFKLAYARDKYEARRWYRADVAPFAHDAQPETKIAVVAQSVARPAAEPRCDPSSASAPSTMLPLRPATSRSGLPAARRVQPLPPRQPSLLDSAPPANLSLSDPIDETLGLAPALRACQDACAVQPTADPHAHKASAVLAAYGGSNGGACRDPQGAACLPGLGSKSPGRPVIADGKAFFAAFGL